MISDTIGIFIRIKFKKVYLLFNTYFPPIYLKY